MNEELKAERLVRYAILCCELLLLNLLIGLFLETNILFDSSHLSELQIYALNSLCFAMANIATGVVAHLTWTRGDQIIRRSCSCIIIYVLLSLAVLYIFKEEIRPWPGFLLFYVLLTGLILINRFIWRRLTQAYRSREGHLKKAVIVGNLGNAVELMKILSFKRSGYKILGYFADEEDENLGGEIPYLGLPCDAVGWVAKHASLVNQVFSTLPSSRNESKELFFVCENNLVRFYVIPSIYTYMHRRVHLSSIQGVPVLNLRLEPLSFVGNRFLKRAFDLCCSLIFLICIFPWICIIFGIAIKMSSPGPIFFKQKRNGINGKEFLCYKFRSMKVNAQGDFLQATKDDPRKTKIGEFMRHTNIDELPQFINVLRGEMSMVGPRPHMLKHTEEYSKLIEKYMVRHFVKPGITGWAQVTGFRGETKELRQMSERIKKDIWYIEHWSFWLDLFIIYRTVVNMFRGDSEAY